MLLHDVAQVQLSTYGDSLGTNLKDLKQFIDSNLQGASVARPLSWSAGRHGGDSREAAASPSSVTPGSLEPGPSSAHYP